MWGVVVPAAAGLAGVGLSQIFTLLGNRQRYRAEHEERLWQKRVDLYLEVLAFLRDMPGEQYDEAADTGRPFVCGFADFVRPDALLEARVTAFASHTVRAMWQRVIADRWECQINPDGDLDRLATTWRASQEAIQLRIQRELEQHAYAKPRFRRFSP